MPVDLAPVQLLRLEAWFWAAALLLLYCSRQQQPPHTLGLTLFYLKPLHSRSTGITSLEIILCNTHRKITCSIYNPGSPGLDRVSAGSIRKALSSHWLKIHGTLSASAKKRLGWVGESDGKKCAEECIFGICSAPPKIHFVPCGPPLTPSMKTAILSQLSLILSPCLCSIIKKVAQNSHQD